MLPLNLSMLKSKHSERSLEELEILTFFFFDLLKFMPNPQVLVMIPAHLCFFSVFSFIQTFGLILNYRITSLRSVDLKGGLH